MLSKRAPLQPGRSYQPANSLAISCWNWVARQEALKEFDVALAMAPQRSAAITGAVRATEMAGNHRQGHVYD